MLMQIAPRNARPRNPENPIQNKTMVPRATTTARAPLNHEWFKAGPFLVPHQTPKHDSLPKSYRESETTPVGNSLCQRLLVHALIHTADIQDRDGAPMLLAEVVTCFPWLRHLFADGGYAGDKLRQALRCIGKWIVEIIKRSGVAKGAPR